MGCLTAQQTVGNSICTVTWAYLDKLQQATLCHEQADAMRDQPGKLSPVLCSQPAPALPATPAAPAVVVNAKRGWRGQHFTAAPEQLLSTGRKLTSLVDDSTAEWQPNMPEHKPWLKAAAPRPQATLQFNQHNGGLQSVARHNLRQMLHRYNAQGNCINCIHQTRPNMTNHTCTPDTLRM
jgi:hypothetical protein